MTKINLLMKFHSVYKSTICKNYLSKILNMFKIIKKKHAPLKKKYLTASHSKFDIKELSKAIMLRSKLRTLLQNYIIIEQMNRGANTKKKKNLCIFITKTQKGLL